MSLLEKQFGRPRRRAHRLRVERLERRAVSGIPLAWLAYELNTLVPESPPAIIQERVATNDTNQAEHSPAAALRRESRLGGNRDPPVANSRAPPPRQCCRHDCRNIHERLLQNDTYFYGTTSALETPKNERGAGFNTEKGYSHGYC